MPRAPENATFQSVYLVNLVMSKLNFWETSCSEIRFIVILHGKCKSKWLLDLWQIFVCGNAAGACTWDMTRSGARDMAHTDSCDLTHSEQCHYGLYVRPVCARWLIHTCVT